MARRGRGAVGRGGGAVGRGGDAAGRSGAQRGAAGRGAARRSAARRGAAGVTYECSRIFVILAELEVYKLYVYVHSTRSIRQSVK